MFRITGDDWDKWDDIDPWHFDNAAAFAPMIARAGLMGQSSYPDLDMLPLGFVSASGDSHHYPTHQTNLTNDEATVQFTLWCIARSPLFFGGDMPHLATDPFTFGLLTDVEVLNMNEFSKNNREVKNDPEKKLRFWAAESTKNEGFYYAAIFNNAEDDQNVNVLDIDFAFPPNAVDVFDVWAKEPVTNDELSALNVKTHGTRLLRFFTKGNDN